MRNEGVEAKEFARFLEALRAATAEIDRKYCFIPVGDGKTVVRERVYCYELYHQLRNRLRDDSGDLLLENPTPTLMAELDKAGTLHHPEDLRGVKPDLVFHVPGSAEFDRLVIEVKPLRGIRRAQGEKDLKHLALFVLVRGYYAGIFLVYGSPVRGLPDWLLRRVESREGGSRSQILLMWHKSPGESAEFVGRIDARDLVPPRHGTRGNSSANSAPVRNESA